MITPKIQGALSQKKKKKKCFTNVKQNKNKRKLHFMRRPTQAD